MNDLWTVKYSPETVGDMILCDEQKRMFNAMLESGSMSNLLLAGVQGSGKTTLAKILARKSNAHWMLQSCSADGSVDMVKSTVLNFCQMMPEEGRFKLVILDEADQLSQTAQMALRNIIVDSAVDTRFILTCNYIDKIIPAIQSRCTPVRLGFDFTDIVRRAAVILTAEHVKASKQDLAVFFKAVRPLAPDIRAIFERLQLCSREGSLDPALLDRSAENIVDGDEPVDMILSDAPPLAVRQWLLQHEDMFSADWERLASRLFRRLEDPEKMLVVAEALYRMSTVLDKEVQFTAMLIELKK